MIKKCKAIDCKKEFRPKTKDQMYCSARCRYRIYKRRIYNERKINGLCQQCGSELNTNVSHCVKCQNYFRDRYYSKKEQLKL